ncbi:MAG: hypothetical protein RMX68_022225 [Aulosira sp. ZfuVER01]|nr:hypothetical protein [Aulosira sp. ZfuVER01]MDZ8002954.1 hypothetical protein [Aulosira sp. DedVER01a]MDZ8053531.1 hypothetical protein [Aulosira sp. ZfuCHP01]
MKTKKAIARAQNLLMVIPMQETRLLLAAVILTQLDAKHSR